MREQGSEPDSDMAGIMELPDQGFKTIIMMLRALKNEQYTRANGQCQQRWKL